MQHCVVYNTIKNYLPFITYILYIIPCDDFYNLDMIVTICDIQWVSTSLLLYLRLYVQFCVTMCAFASLNEIFIHM